MASLRAAGTPVAAAVSPPGTHLPVTLFQQDQRKWCWAACAQMVLHYYQVQGVAQCDIANFALNRTDCSCSPPWRKCNQGCKMADVDKILVNWGLSSAYTSSSTPFATLTTELNGARPVEVAFVWSKGGGHTAIVSGWVQIGGVAYLQVEDPDKRRRSGLVRYADLVSAYGMGSWSHTWTGIQ